MTVRFLTAWNGYAFGQIATLDEAVETRLVNGMLAESYTAASTDLVARIRVASDGTTVQGLVGPDGSTVPLGGGAFTDLEDAPNSIVPGCMLVGNADGTGLTFSPGVTLDPAGWEVYLINPEGGQSLYVFGKPGGWDGDGDTYAAVRSEEGWAQLELKAGSEELRMTMQNGLATIQAINHGGGPVIPLQFPSAKLRMPNLPTSNPGVAGELWNDAGTLKISAG